jgi:hypothetical protein
MRYPHRIISSCDQRARRIIDNEQVRFKQIEQMTPRSDNAFHRALYEKSLDNQYLGKVDRQFRLQRRFWQNWRLQYADSVRIEFPVGGNDIPHDATHFVTRLTQPNGQFGEIPDMAHAGTQFPSDCDS